MLDYVARSVNCATCEHWTGQRTSDPDDWRVYTPRHCTIGVCDSPTGPWKGRFKPGESSCRHWIRWMEVQTDMPGR